MAVGLRYEEGFEKENCPSRSLINTMKCLGGEWE